MGILCGIVWCVLLFHGFTVAQDLQAFIKRKEEQVMLMAAEIVRLHEARCELAANCSSSCSRRACTPIQGFDNPNKYNFTCKQMERSQYCSALPSGGACNGRIVNRAMSYIRMPLNATISEIPDEMCSTICMTRDFTSTLRTLANEEKFEEGFYFGSIEGVQRLFPGEEDSTETCWSYDPRKRPWYNGAISVQKHLSVLIDHGYVTQNQVPWPLLSVIEASKRIVRELMYTLSPNDVVNVIRFNETNADSLSSNPVLIPDDVGLGLKGQMKDLFDNISNIIATQQSIASYSQGFVEGISSALQPDNYEGEFLKVILLVTNGDFATDLKAADIQRISEMLKNQSTQLLIYSFDKSDNLTALANESSGYFEFINAKFDNPLYQISSFFNFMALARNASTKNTPYWTKFYVDSGGLGNIITVSYQAVSPNGHLVGVTAIDIALQSVLTNLPIALGDRLASRPTNSNALVGRIEPTNNTCETCDGSKAVCGRTSNTTFTQLYCCDNCTSAMGAPNTSPPVKNGSKKWNAAKIIIVAVVPASVVVLLFIALLVCKRMRSKKPTQSPLRPFGSIVYDLGPYS